MKSKNLRLRNRAWKLFSLFIRKRDKHCFTCGAYKNITELDAGHFIHGKTTPIYFDETNVHAQCTFCNRYMHGNLIDYTVNMISEYGQGKVDSLRAQKHKIKKWKISELEAMIKKYSRDSLK